MIDLYIVYKILRRLTSPFTKWKAFKLGIIDKDGDILIDKEDRKNDPKLKKAFTKLDLLILRFKKLISRQPMMNRKFASLAAAMWMIRENYDIDPDMITEENLLENMSLLKEEDGGTPPTNNTMNVAGADGTEVVVSKKAQKDIVRRVRKKKRRKE